jgi:hypothetical protein
MAGGAQAAAGGIMTGTTSGGGGGKSGEGWQHGPMGTIGASHTGVAGSPQATAGPHWNANPGLPVRTAPQIKRSKQAKNRTTMVCSI